MATVPEQGRKAAVEGRARSRGGPRDIIAGLINAVVSVPDGLASAALVGVNPIYGLYTSIAAPIAGSLLVSTQLMQISTTSASALAAGQAVAGQQGLAREQALFLLVALVGLFQVLFGLLRLGRLSKYVAHSVMTGFLLGVAVTLILDQLAPFVGYSPTGPNEVAQAWDLLRNAASFDPRTIVAGALTLAIVVAMNKTRLASVGTLIAMVVPALLVAALGWENVQLVNDVSPIPRGVPLPALPAPSAFSLELLSSAMAIAIVILVQGAGVSQSFPNRDGSPSNPSRDFVAQGAANIASGLFRGIPAGGSVGQTALNVTLGAQTRLSGIMGGVWMLAIIALIPGLVGQVPMAVLGALMILSGVSAISLPEASSIWATGWGARLSLLVTFIATLFLSIPVAVGLGVVLSVVFYLASSSTDVTVRAVVELPDGRLEEREPPKQLPSNQVTVLDIYGSLFFAGARTLGERLPAVGGAVAPAVVLRMRGRTSVGATLVEVLDGYAEQLAAAGGRLYLSGVDAAAYTQLQRTGKLDLDGEVQVYSATSVVSESSRRAFADARAWVARQQQRSPA